MNLDNTDGRFTPERINAAGYELFAANVVNPSVTNVFAVSNGVTLSNYTLPSTGKSTLKVTIPTLGGTGLSLVSAPLTAVVGTTRLVGTFKWRKFSSSDATMTLRPNLDWYNANQVLIRSHPLTATIAVSSDTTATTGTFSCEVPVDAYFVKVRFSNSTGTTATNLLLEECHLNNDDPYVIFDSAFGAYKSKVTPNRRVKVHSVMGGNLMPRWVASPILGQESYAPGGRFERTDGPSGQHWWTYSFQSVGSPPTADAGNTSFRVKMNKATANAVTGTAVGVTGFYAQTPIYANRQYRIRFWARADTGVGIPPSGTFRVETFDRANNSSSWNFTSVAWTPTDGTWFRFDQTINTVADHKSIDLRITNHFGDAVLSQNVTSDYAIEFMGLQVQDVTTDANPLDYAYVEKWSSTTYNPYGNQEVELTASDDFRIFSDTILPNPVRGGVLADPSLVMYYPFDDPAGSTRALDGFNSTAGGGNMVNSTSGAATLTFGVTGFVGGANDGTCLQFSAPSPSTAGTYIGTNATMSNAFRITSTPDTGFQLSFWFKVPAGSRPADGSHYAVFAASRWSDWASTHLVSLFGDANGDYVYTRWAHISTGYLVAKTRGTLFDGNPHFVVINGAALTNPSNGGRAISVYVDGVLAGSTTTPTGAAPVADDYYIGASPDTTGSTFRWQYVGFLSHLSLSTSNALSPTDRYTAKLWEKAPSKTGGFALRYICQCVNPTRYAAVDVDTGPTTGYNLYPATFTNSSALSVVQDIAKDLRGFIYANRDGRISWFKRDTVAALLNGTPTVGQGITLDFAQGEAPEPGWSYEADITKIYNYVEGTHINSGNTYTNIDTTSVQRYGKRVYSFESNLSVAANVEQQVADLLGGDDAYDEPKVQLGDLTFNLAANYPMAAKLLRLDLLGIITLTNLPDYAPWATTYLQVERIQHSVTVNGGICDWNTTISVYNVGTPVDHDLKPVPY
jgi:hypothetical protein